MARSLSLQLALAVSLAILTVLLVESCLWIFPEMGWDILYILYIAIVVLQILFYYLTTYTNVWLSILNFTINFLLWIAEQVNIEHAFNDTFFYKNEEWKIAVVILGGLLWAINKIIIDKIFLVFNFKKAQLNKMETILKLKPLSGMTTGL